MSVDRVNGPRALGRLDPLAGNLNNGRDARATASEPADRVELSSEARQLAGLTERNNALPEVRRDKVDELRRSVIEGTYEVDSRQVARTILELEDDLGS